MFCEKDGSAKLSYFFVFLELHEVKFKYFTFITQTNKERKISNFYASNISG